VKFPGATHLVIGFQYREDAERLVREFQERLGKFGLELYPEKTSRMREFRTYGSVRGVLGNWHPYRDGISTASFRGEEAKIVCDECEKVVRTVSKKPTYNALSMKWNCRWASPALNARILEPSI
jgi:hypothetical protein